MSMLSRHLDNAEIPHNIVGHPSLFDVVFTQSPVRDYRFVRDTNAKRAAVFNQVLRHQGILKSPGKIYPSLALGEDDLHLMDTAIREATSIVLAMRSDDD